jgi:hypothetical protein
MSLTLEAKANIAYKKTVGKVHTDSLKNDYNETESTFPTVAFDKIFTQNIDINPSSAINEGVAMSLTVDLIEDITSNGHSYFAVYKNDISSLGVLAGDRVTNIIPPSFGYMYGIQVFDISGKIYLNDTSNWVFYYPAGVFFQEDVEVTPTEATLYVYIGDTLESSIENTAFIDGSNIERKPFNENLLTSTTSNVLIYVNKPTDSTYPGSDSAGDGSEVAPFETLEKALYTIAYSQIKDYSLTILLGEGTFTLTDEYIQLIKSLRNVGANLEIIGLAETINSITLTPDGYRNRFTFTGPTVTENSLRKKFLKDGGELYPIAYNNNSIIYSSNKASAASEVVNLRTTLVFTNNKQINSNVDSNSTSGLVIKNCNINFSSNLLIKNSINQTRFLNCYINNDLYLYNINKYLINNCYIDGAIVSYNTNLIARNVIFSPSDTVKDATKPYSLYAENSIIYTTGSIFQNSNVALDLYNTKITDSLISSESITFRECNYLTTLKENTVSFGNSDIIETSEIANFSITEPENVSPNIFFSIKASNIFGVFPSVVSYKTIQSEKNIFIYIKNFTENYFKQKSNIIYSTKAEIINLDSNSKFVGCVETGRLYKYVTNGSEYTVDNLKVFATADGGITRFIAITSDSLQKIEFFTNESLVTVNHTLYKYPNVKVLIEGDTSGELHLSMCKVIYLSPTSFRVEFGTAYTGQIVYE